MRKGVLLILITIAALIVASYYLFFSNEQLSVSNVVSKISKSSEEKYFESLSQNDIEKAVFFSLPDHITKPTEGGKLFCSEKVFGYDYSDSGKLVNVYLYANCEEYYLKADKITLGLTLASPVVTRFKINAEKLVFDSLNLQPNNQNISDFFPKEYVDKAQNTDASQIVPSPNTQAQNYYKGKLEVYF